MTVQSRQANDMPDNGVTFDLGDVLEVRNPTSHKPERTVRIIECLPMFDAAHRAMREERLKPDKVYGISKDVRVEKIRRIWQQYRVEPVGKPSLAGGKGGRKTLVRENTLREHYRRIERGAKEQAA
ncbi:hypothetical protein HOT31_gp043 [Microbacterium phage Hendrix]|uniref:Uncharacterized protein n=1 Tax=Microbacterium phage Hendrix TaxID=2182341 RepID=A0A2U8UU71_9CAUD|nr:hypothetical protein HOT31_gp043 [Microbacterium phage Hendrix]AWN07714.1 hypothetical protein PBI_HENDRIX_43 [Microbacterium phage Hendrix]